MSGEALSVLIVDDEVMNQEILSEYLGESDYDLSTASDGAEAWRRLEDAPCGYDIILLDRRMPNMDGMEVLARMKANPTLRNVPVILQTSMAANGEIAEGIKAGAYYYLTKPYDKDVLKSVVATAGDDRRRHLADLEASERTALTPVLTDSARFRLRNLDEARALASFLANTCLNPQSAVMGFSELLVNAIEHGNLGIGYDEKSDLKARGVWEAEVERRLADPDHAEKYVVVEFERDAREVRVRIADQGDGFEWERYLELDPARAMDNHGRGIALSKALSFDSVSYQGRGNVVEVRVGANAA